MNKIFDRLVLIGGGNAQALELVPSARAAFQQFAVVLLFTATMATASMWFALHDAVHVPALLALPAACFWGVGIFILDRTLMVAGMGGSTAGTLASAAGRLLAAALIGVVVSTPLTLRIFSSDIQSELGKMQAAQSAVNKSAIADSQEQSRVTDLQKQIDDWENIKAGVLPASFADAASSGMAQQLTALQGQLKTDQHAADQAAILYNCDMYGGGRDKLDDPSKCAAKPGPNGNAQLYHAEAVSAAQVVTADLARIDSLQRRLNAANQDKLDSLRPQAAGHLATLRPQLTTAQGSLSSFQVGLEQDNRGNTGLLAQLEGLWKAGEGNVGLMIAHLLIALLFMLIEFLPVLAKLLWLFGRGGRAYEEAASSVDDAGLAVAQSRRAEAQIQAETEYDAALIAKDAELDEKRLEAEHRQDVLRARHEADRIVEEARAREIAAQKRTIDAEYEDRREAELRRRAEADFQAWAAANPGGTITYARFGEATRPVAVVPEQRTSRFRRTRRQVAE